MSVKVTATYASGLLGGVGKGGARSLFDRLITLILMKRMDDGDGLPASGFIMILIVFGEMLIYILKTSWK